VGIYSNEPCGKHQPTNEKVIEEGSGCLRRTQVEGELFFVLKKEIAQSSKSIKGRKENVGGGYFSGDFPMVKKKGKRRKKWAGLQRSFYTARERRWRKEGVEWTGLGTRINDGGPGDGGVGLRTRDKEGVCCGDRDVEV